MPPSQIRQYGVSRQHGGLYASITNRPSSLANPGPIADPGPHPLVGAKGTTSPQRRAGMSGSVGHGQDETGQIILNFIVYKPKIMCRLHPTSRKRAGKPGFRGETGLPSIARWSHKRGCRKGVNPVTGHAFSMMEGRSAATCPKGGRGGGHQTYVYWIVRFTRFCLECLKQTPQDAGTPALTAYLNYLALERNVSDSTRNQALNAMVFLTRKVFGVEDFTIERRATVTPNAVRQSCSPAGKSPPSSPTSKIRGNSPPN